jgi:hypothetical protein
MPIRNDYAAIMVPDAPRPALRTTVTDPVFGTRLTRVTDPRMAPDDQDDTTLGLRHEYARYPGLNANGTLAVVVVIGGAWRGAYKVLELATGRIVCDLPVAGGDAEAAWDQHDPTLITFRSGNNLCRLYSDSGMLEISMVWPNYVAVSTNQEGRLSDDGRYAALIAYQDEAHTRCDLLVADLSAGTNLHKWKDPGVPNWISMSPSGEYVVVQWADSRGTRCYDRQLRYLHTLVQDYPHGDFALDAAGDEVFVYQASSGAAIAALGCPRAPGGQPLASTRLADGQQQLLLGDCYTADWRQQITGTFLNWEWFGVHVSGTASRAHPGWALVSTYTDPYNAQEPLSREIFWLALDGSGRVKRIAHHHSDQEVYRGEKDYFAEPHASSTWDGNTVVFSSTWGSAFAEYDLYTLTGDWW